MRMPDMVTRQEFAYREALRSITQQQTALEGFHNRAAAVFGGATAGSAFIAGQALPAASWGWLGVVALVLYGVATAGFFCVVWPREFHFSFNPIEMLDGWEGYDEVEHYEHLARFLERQHEGNKAALERIATALQVGIGFTALSLAAWVCLLVLK